MSKEAEIRQFEEKRKQIEAFIAEQVRETQEKGKRILDAIDQRLAELRK